jgi:hypothetical protein
LPGNIARFQRLTSATHLASALLSIDAERIFFKHNSVMQAFLGQQHFTTSLSPIPVLHRFCRPQQLVAQGAHQIRSGRDSAMSLRWLSNLSLFSKIQNKLNGIYFLLINVDSSFLVHLCKPCFFTTRSKYYVSDLLNS